MDNNDNTPKTIGRVIGYIFGTIIFTCLAAAAVALTAKFILWLF